MRFRFFTNASAVREQGALFPGGVSGIETWNALAVGSIGGRKRKDAVQEIRRLLTTSGRTDVSESEALVAKVFGSMQDSSKLEQLIADFEFSMGNPATAELRPLVESRLIERRLAQSTDEALQLYEKLFVRVFETIGRPGEKRLDRALLEETVCEGTLAAADRRLLAQIHVFLSGAEARFNVIEEQLAEVRAGIDTFITELSGTPMGHAGARLSRRSTVFKTVARPASWSRVGSTPMHPPPAKFELE